MKNQEYKEYVEKRAKGSPTVKNSIFAFVFGGGICILGQIFIDLYTFLGVDEKTSYTLGSITLVFIAVTLTGLGVFDNVAKMAGAGTLVPITGFANAVSSQAIDSRSEGYVLGVGAKMFTVAGPVIVFGITSGVIYGIIYCILAVIK